MQNQTLIKISVIALALLLLMVWLWPSDDSTAPADAASESNQLVSAIQPINDADALTLSGELPEITTESASASPEQRDQQEFDQALNAIRAEDFSTAEALLMQIIERQPGLLEPHINLASVQAAKGNLAEARAALNRGLTANPNYAAMYENLKKVHSAMAANAYREALAEDGELKQTEQKLELPVVASLNPSVSPVSAEALEKANALIAQLESNVKSQQELLAQREEDLLAANTSLERELQSTTDLRNQLQSAEAVASQNSAASTQTSNRIATLETQLAEARAQQRAMQQTHQSELAALRRELTEQNELLAAQTREAQQQQEQLNTQIAALTAANSAQNAVASSTATPVQPTVASNQPTSVEPDDSQEQVIERVKSWASAWSNQDVESYIEHYRDGYIPPGSGITHADWRAQRQVRLTNKRFIEVSLSDFKADLQGDRMRVTFTQRYRSNTMDDTIRKQLVLNSNDNDWRRAKIVSERVIR